MYGAKGYLERGLEEPSGTFPNGAAVANYAEGSDTLAGSISRNYGRVLLVAQSGCTDVIIEGGFNDLVTLGASAATIESELTALGNQYLGVGNVKRVRLDTIWPGSTSSDGFTTLTNQTVAGSNTARATVNAWERTNPAPFTNFNLDSAAVVDPGDTGKWQFSVGGNTYGCDFIVSGLARGQTCDGVHMPLAGIVGITAPYVASVLPSLATN
jgi:hypothetical protein